MTPSNKDQLEDFLNSTHVPRDAGEHADGLRQILSRIPDGWGRWISCDKGWYPLIIELDQKLAEIFPDYKVHQVKEKYGTLRYYIGFPDLNPQCCIDIKEIRPVAGAINPAWMRASDGERTLQQQYELDKWFYEVFTLHLKSEDHYAGLAELAPEQARRRAANEKMFTIINEYENRSAKICESCSDPADMKQSGYWYKTLCDSCAVEQGYEHLPREEENQ